MTDLDKTVAYFRQQVRKQPCPKCKAESGQYCIVFVEPRFYKDDGLAYVNWLHDERSMAHYNAPKSTVSPFPPKAQCGLLYTHPGHAMGNDGSCDGWLY